MEEKSNVVNINNLKKNATRAGKKISDFSKNTTNNLIKGVSDYLSNGRKADAEVRKAAFDSIKNLDNELKKEAHLEANKEEQKTQRLGKVIDGVVVVTLIVCSTIVIDRFKGDSSLS